MCHNVHMHSITIRELHMHTGKWVRAVAESSPVLILDRGRPIARIVPLEIQKPFRKRRYVKGFESLPLIEVDSGRVLEDDRR
jgi:prevent-host-death family protein